MNKHGQSIIEYTLIAILVILGIVYMGPYVLRSVNGYFKLWDSGVQDSFEEGLNQALVNDIPNIPFNCACSPPVDEGCATSGCAPGYRAYTQICTPLGCNGAQATTCTADPTCCNLTPAGCGTVPLTSPLPSPLNNCYYGQELKTSGCTPVCNPPSITTNCAPAPECVPDPACPLPACQGTIPSPGGKLCPGADTGLSQPFSYTHVSTCPTFPPSTPQCQYTCLKGFAQNPTCTITYRVAAAIEPYCFSGPCSYTNNKSRTWCFEPGTVITAACSYNVNKTASCNPSTPPISCPNSTRLYSCDPTSYPENSPSGPDAGCGNHTGYQCCPYTSGTRTTGTSDSGTICTIATPCACSLLHPCCYSSRACDPRAHPRTKCGITVTIS